MHTTQSYFNFLEQPKKQYAGENTAGNSNWMNQVWILTLFRSSKQITFKNNCFSFVAILVAVLSFNNTWKYSEDCCIFKQHLAEIKLLSISVLSFGCCGCCFIFLFQIQALFFYLIIWALQSSMSKVRLQICMSVSVVKNKNEIDFSLGNT